MNEQLIRLAKRYLHQMMTIQKVASEGQLSAVERKVALAQFQGFGLALAMVFEEVTKREGNSIKPIDLMKWANDLPQVKKLEYVNDTAKGLII